MAKQAKTNGLPVIEKGIPIPRRIQNNAYTSLFRAMNVGESVLMDAKRAMTARTMILRFAPARFTTRKEGDSVRFWRIE